MKSRGCIRFRLSLGPARSVHLALFSSSARATPRVQEHVPGTPIHRAGFFNGPKANKNANPPNQRRFRFPVPGGGARRGETRPLLAACFSSPGYFYATGSLIKTSARLRTN